MKIIEMFWRRGWDSNPRARFWQARRFRGAPVMTTSVPLPPGSEILATGQKPTLGQRGVHASAAVENAYQHVFCPEQVELLSDFLCCAFVPALFEECTEYCRTFLRQHALSHLKLMIQPRVIHHIQGGATRPSFGIARAENKMPDPRVDHCASAHGARFDCNIQGATLQPVVAQFACRSSQGQNLCVRGRVVQMEGAVVSSRQHLAFVNHHGSHRNLALSCRLLRFAESKPHKL